MIRAVVDRFYAAAREDEIIGPVFKAAVPDERWRAHLETIGDFWSSMLLGSRRYEGRPLRKHLMLPDLQDAHFRRWLALFRRTVEELCRPAVAQFWADRADKIGNAFRISVRMHHGDEVLHLRPSSARRSPNLKAPQLPKMRTFSSSRRTAAAQEYGCGSRIRTSVREATRDIARRLGYTGIGNARAKL